MTDGQILITSRVVTAIGERAHIESLGDLALKGLSRPVAVAKVLALQGDAISG